MGNEPSKQTPPPPPVVKLEGIPELKIVDLQVAKLPPIKTQS
jgi:hypothetical protein